MISIRAQYGAVSSKDDTANHSNDLTVLQVSLRLHVLDEIYGNFPFEIQKYCLVNMVIIIYFIERKHLYFDTDYTVDFIEAGTEKVISLLHDHVIKWKHFPRYWPFVPGIHQYPVNSLYKASDTEL